jgi:hypothetical protein
MAAKKKDRQGRQAAKAAKKLGGRSNPPVSEWNLGGVILPPPPQNLGALGGLAALAFPFSGMNVAKVVLR